MSDIHVKLTGDGSGAKHAFDEGGEGAKQFGEHAGAAAERLHMLVEFAEKAGEAIVEFAKESIEAYGKEEVALKQMAHAAGENAEAFKIQAEEFKNHLGVSGDMIMHMQQLALQFGTLPSEVQPATEAILDWSAATGNDATSGMQALVRAVDFGQGKVKSLGIEFDVTGNKTQDLKNAISALNEKFGGSGDVMADTLVGRTHKSKEAFEDLQKAVGSAFDTVDTKLGILDKLTAGLKNMQEPLRVASNLFGGKSLFSGTRLGEHEPEAGVVDPEKGGEGTLFGGVSLTSDLGAVGRGALGAGVRSQGDEMLAFKRAQAEKLKALDKELAKDLASNRQKLNEDDDEKLQEHATQVALDEVRRMQEGQKATMAEQDKEQKEKDKIQKEQWDAEYKIHEKEESDTRAHLKRLQEIARAEGLKFKEEMMTMGAQIGEALTRTLASALEAAMTGGEFDVVGAMEDLGFAVAAIAGTAIGTLYGNAAVGQAIGTGIAAVGGLVHNENARSWSASHPTKKHDGGWIEPERYHSGGWPGMGSDERPIIAQTGEAVFSRGDVARNGGRQGVEAIRRGGGAQLTVNIAAMDTQSVMESFQDKGGRGLFNTLRTGRGLLLPVFNRG